MDWPILANALWVMLGFIGMLVALGAVVVFSARRHRRHAIENTERRPTDADQRGEP